MVYVLCVDVTHTHTCTHTHTHTSYTALPPSLHIASNVSNATNDRPYSDMVAYTSEDNKNEVESAGSIEMKVEVNGERGASTAREKTVYTEFNEET